MQIEHPHRSIQNEMGALLIDAVVPHGKRVMRVSSRYGV